MSHPVTSYTNALVAKFDRYAAWPPNTRLRLGDIGVLERNLFRYRSNLETFGIQFEYFAGPLGTLDHSSGFTIEVNAEVGGQAIAAGPVKAAKAKLSFSKSGAFVFQATGSRHSEIRKKDQLAKDLRRLYEAHVWDPDWVVIENLTKVERATIIVADFDGGSLEVSADGGFPLGSVPLASVRGSLQVTSRSGDFTTFLAEQELTPMFQLLKVKRDWLEHAWDFVNEGEVLEWHPPR